MKKNETRNVSGEVKKPQAYRKDLPPTPGEKKTITKKGKKNLTNIADCSLLANLETVDKYQPFSHCVV